MSITKAISSHTPGPWRVHPYVVMTGKYNAGRDIGPGLRAVARAIGEFETDTPTAETEANALLIAASPTMFEFVTLIAEFSEPGRDPEDDAETLKSLIRSARTIRAQATVAL